MLRTDMLSYTLKYADADVSLSVGIVASVFLIFVLDYLVYKSLVT